MIQAMRTYGEVAALLGLPAFRVREIERQALAKIRCDKQLRALNKESEREEQNEKQEYHISAENI